MNRNALRLSLGATALAVAVAAIALGDAEAQAWSYANTAQYQIRQYPPSKVCPPGFGAETFNYAGWGVRTYCISCPAGYIFAATAGSYACVSCPSGTYMSARAGYKICVK